MSVPDIAVAIPMKVDSLRKLLKQNPALLQFFDQAGPLKVLPAERLPELRETIAKIPSRRSSDQQLTSSAE
ncbi:MAG: hypothetical protein C0467_31520 [Planctomycetaceae bacterium]|nr:hypothetical protein [Planctomycetaceae bacterium]